MASESSPGPTDHDSEPIGFFTIPRELRNRIYSMVREEHTLTLNRKTFVCRVPVPSIRLVSRQVKSEYDESSQENSSVHLLDSLHIFKEGERFPLLATKSRRLVVSWSVLYDCEKPMAGLQDSNSDDKVEIGRHLSKLTHLSRKLPFVQEVCICMYIQPEKHLKRVVEQLIACPVVTGLVVRSYNSLRPAVVKDRSLYAVWTLKRGILLDNTDRCEALQ